MNTDGRVSAFEIVILYDSIGAGKRATELCHRLAAKLGPQYQLQLHCWRITILQNPSVAALVARETACSPCLVIAVNGNNPLAWPLKEFLNHHACAMRRTGTALVAQLYGIYKTDREISPAYRCLNQIAQNSGMRFLSEAIPPSDGESLGILKERVGIRSSLFSEP